MLIAVILAELWGLDESGCFLTGEGPTDAFSRVTSLFKKSPPRANVRKVVYDELHAVEENYCNEIAFFESPRVSLKDKGKRLMFLFQCDLLPGISGKILESKGERDFYTVKKVDPFLKLFCWVFVWLLNGGMLFYVFLFALNQTKHRQNAWFNSFMVWLIIEILMVSTASALVTHVFIPSMVMKDVTKIKGRLLESIRSFNSSVARAKREGGAAEAPAELTEFNAAKYLFVASRLATKFSTLKESALVAHFSTPWPRQSYQHVKDVSKGYNRRFAAVTKSISIILVFFITGLLNIPATLQDMIIHMVTTTSVGYTILLHMKLFNIFPLLAFGPFLMLCLIVHFIIKSGKSQAKARLAKLMPLNEIKAVPVTSKDDNYEAVESPAAQVAGELFIPVEEVDGVAGQPVRRNVHRTRRQSVQAGIDILKRVAAETSDDEEKQVEKEEDNEKETLEESANAVHDEKYVLYPTPEVAPDAGRPLFHLSEDEEDDTSFASGIITEEAITSVMIEKRLVNLYDINPADQARYAKAIAADSDFQCYSARMIANAKEAEQLHIAAQSDDEFSYPSGMNDMIKEDLGHESLIADIRENQFRFASQQRNYSRESLDYEEADDYDLGSIVRNEEQSEDSLDTGAFALFGDLQRNRH